MVKKIPTGRVKVGDVLAEPVVHGEGQKLLVAGTEIAATHIDMLRQRGVLLVTIVDPDADPNEVEEPPRPLDADEIKKVVLEEGRWFGDSRKNPIMAEVFRWVVKKKSAGESHA